MTRDLVGMKLGMWQLGLLLILITHTVLTEALEKWPQAVMEIIEEIDKRFMAMIHSTLSSMENKLSDMPILDSSNPQKPAMRMANLCVMSSHKVNGVAELHSDIEGRLIY